ncbi:MAG: hypothetical protein CL925_13145 [Deltaproteobacteria bacterium]|nr:hypothetical protein [Deltaproteobacteria bacterium]
MDSLTFFVLESASYETQDDVSLDPQNADSAAGLCAFKLSRQLDPGTGHELFYCSRKEKGNTTKKSFQTKSPPETSSSSKAQTEAEAGGGEKT